MSGGYVWLKDKTYKNGKSHKMGEWKESPLNDARLRFQIENELDSGKGRKMEELSYYNAEKQLGLSDKLSAIAKKWKEDGADWIKAYHLKNEIKEITPKSVKQAYKIYVKNMINMIESETNIIPGPEFGSGMAMGGYAKGITSKGAIRKPNKWNMFLKEFASKHPELKGNFKAMVSAAKIAYRMPKGSGKKGKKSLGGKKYYL